MPSACSSTAARATLDELEAIAGSLAELVDWPAILDGRDEDFRVRPGATKPEAYCRSVA